MMMEMYQKNQWYDAHFSPAGGGKESKKAGLMLCNDWVGLVMCKRMQGYSESLICHILEMREKLFVSEPPASSFPSMQEGFPDHYTRCWSHTRLDICIQLLLQPYLGLWASFKTHCWLSCKCWVGGHPANYSFHQSSHERFMDLGRQAGWYAQSDHKKPARDHFLDTFFFYCSMECLLFNFTFQDPKPSSSMLNGTSFYLSWDNQQQWVKRLFIFEITNNSEW